ncbi:hypothetical protein [Pontibacter sp. G13]|uniref:hypothetical protein n=1 Tax=Pontibacter sp. G13 TaxID=3074898 RepID=UPI00288B4CB6|nr:hypothetical protein [Pontibacter sp. G13]WNJ16786.1 hypothetical protein RJD25_18110 [Pontibacter sp. G13]
MMKRPLLKFTLAVILACSSLSLYAQTEPREATMEALIDRFIQPYILEQDNLFRLSAYAELKGIFSSQHQSLVLDFEGLGQLTLYDRNALLRTSDNRVFTLPKDQPRKIESVMFNDELNEIFEQINLLGKHEASEEKINFVDAGLAKKNIEPFEKIFLRYLLISYGKYDQAKQEVYFHTDWMERDPLFLEDQVMMRMPAGPMTLQLNPTVIRGKFLQSGGNAFVEDFNSPHQYVTGETYQANVAYFKVFAQQLFMQTVEYIAADDESRRNQYTMTVTEQNGHSSKVITSAEFSTTSSGFSEGSSEIPTLYHPNNWIPMMLGKLRSHDVSISDPEVIIYFIETPVYPEIYRHMTPKERKQADMFVNARR